MSLDLREEIAREAQARLLRNPYYSSSRQIAVRLENGVLLLTGMVPTYYLKQIAQTLLYGIEGVERIDNQIEVTCGSPLPRQQLRVAQ